MFIKFLTIAEIIGFDKDDNNLILAAVELEIISAKADDAQKYIQRRQKILPDWMKGSSFVQKAVGNSLNFSGNRTLIRKNGKIQTFEIQDFTINELKYFAEMSLKMNGLFEKSKKYNDTLFKKKVGEERRKKFV